MNRTLKFSSIFFLTSLVFLVPQSYALWYQQQTPTRNSLRSVHFADLNNGWAVGYYGTILHTTDRGHNWVEQKNGVPLASGLTSVFSFNPTKCFVVGASGADTTTFLLKTVDGGGSWDKQSFGVNFEVLWIPWSIVFTDSLDR